MLVDAGQSVPVIDEEAEAAAVVAAALAPFWVTELGTTEVWKPDGEIDDGAMKTAPLLGLEAWLGAATEGFAPDVVETMTVFCWVLDAAVETPARPELPSWTVSVTVTVTTWAGCELGALTGCLDAEGEGASVGAAGAFVGAGADELLPVDPDPGVGCCPTGTSEPWRTGVAVGFTRKAVFSWAAIARDSAD